MNEIMERVLIEALDLMEQGLSVEEITARYPDEAADLRPFLLTAAALSNLASQPTMTAEQQSRRALLATADRVAAQRARPAGVAGGRLRRLMTPALALLAVIMLAGAGVVGGSGSAVPGDALYETKRFVEETRLNLANDPERAAELREQFRLERVREIELLLADGRQAEVSLIGLIETMAAESWTVAGVAVVVPAGTPIDGEPVVGALVQVDGQTGNGVVEAERVMVLSGLMPSIDATPAPQPLPATDNPPTPDVTPEPTTANDNQDDNSGDGAADDNSNTTPESSRQPVVSPTASASPVPLASLTPEPPPTVEPLPTSPPPPPTATPDDDDDNANDNDDDNANANDNDDDNANANANDNDDDNENDNGGDDNGNDNGDDSGD